MLFSRAANLKSDETNSDTKFCLFQLWLSKSNMCRITHKSTWRPSSDISDTTLPNLLLPSHLTFLIPIRWENCTLYNDSSMEPHYQPPTYYYDWVWAWQVENYLFHNEWFHSKYETLLLSQYLQCPNIIDFFWTMQWSQE